MDRRFHDPGLSGQILYIPHMYDLYDLAHVARSEPYNLRHLARICWVVSILLILLYTDPAQDLIKAG